jgi:hypothetical protein
MLMPADVSLAENARAGQKLSAFAIPIDPRFPDEMGAPLDLRMPTMVGWFTPHVGTMDYQSLYGSALHYDRRYLDITNCNYGIVAAAAGYSKEEALMSAGNVNGFLHPFSAEDKAGPFENKVRNADMIIKGYDDYKAGRIIPPTKPN